MRKLFAKYAGVGYLFLFLRRNRRKVEKPLSHSVGAESWNHLNLGWLKLEFVSHHDTTVEKKDNPLDFLVSKNLTRRARIILWVFLLNCNQNLHSSVIELL